MLSGYGVFLSGPVGTGKTFLLRLMGARIYPAANLANSYGIKFLTEWLSATDNNRIPICLDDVGAEQPLNEFGTKGEVVSAIVDHRAAQPTGAFHCTTNLKSAELAGRYGERVVDRLCEICKPFKFDGPSHRRTKPTPRGAVPVMANESPTIQQYAVRYEKLRMRGDEEALAEFWFEVLSEVGEKGLNHLRRNVIRIDRTPISRQDGAVLSQNANK
jgi:hypothetical protein